jgi:hypothetical protein
MRRPIQNRENGFFGILYLFVVVLFFAAQGTGSACGTVDDWVAVYESGEKHKALFHLLDCADNYTAPSDDIALLPIIADALKSGPQVAKAATRVFVNFNHLWGARNEKGYDAVFKKITGHEGWKDFPDYRDWMVVTPAGGANMREGPSIRSPVITAVKYGMQVRVISSAGEWRKVRPVGPGSVDRRFERKVGYVHESLLAPY